ncbi:hypothetical protein MKD50_08705 [Cupriavidus sp. WGtm5]|uniref:hypothetical protein n=1 Tax=Cupriavidus TaxID=106589 RepID=UPI000E10359A|nr:hypothetical protein [Cupriavidus taiwanensis]MCO4889442.1 hypothetical protein [Cupriavidus sp. WGtm5]ULX51252.1 hypothetical protein A9P79_04675 [Cupriavidus taiwanensis]SPA42294.1 conserved hypothetical protein; putative exported protein [Cupriavidus taiwanensis]
MKALSRLNIKPFTLACAALLASVSVHAATTAAQPEPAGNTAAPLGLELGKAKCSRLSPPQNHAKTGTSEWAGGDMVELKHLERFHLNGLSRVVLNCDAQDAVALVTMTFERPAMEEVRRKLDERYVPVRKTEGAAENGYAEWSAANGSLELLYGRDGKHFTVAYWARGAKARYFSYSGGGRKPAAPPQPAPL